MTLGHRSETDEHVRALIDALDEVRTHEATRLYKLRSIELTVPGARRILDAGSGAGDDVLALSEAAAEGCEVVGIDLRRELVEEARRRARNVALHVYFDVADAHALPFASQSFDVVRADRLLEDVVDAELVLAELVRVLRIGGRIVLHHAGPLGQHDARAALTRRLSSLGVNGLVTLTETELVLLGSACTPVVQGVTVVGTKHAHDGAECAHD